MMNATQIAALLAALTVVGKTLARADSDCGYFRTDVAKAFDRKRLLAARDAYALISGDFGPGPLSSVDVREILDAAARRIGGIEGNAVCRIRDRFAGAAR